MFCTSHQISFEWSNKRRMKWAGHVAIMEDIRGAYRSLMGRPKGSSLFGRPRCKWEDNIKIVLLFIFYLFLNFIFLSIY